MSVKDAKQIEPKLEKVVLQKPHTHAGIEYPIGAEIEVSATDKQWLTDNKIIAATAA